VQLCWVLILVFLWNRFKAVKAEAAAVKKPQILAGGFGYGMSGVGVPNGQMSAMGGFHNNGFHNNGFVAQQAPSPEFRNNMQFARLMATRMAAASLRKNVSIKSTTSSFRTSMRVNFET